MQREERGRDGAGDVIVREIERGEFRMGGEGWELAGETVRRHVPEQPIRHTINAEKIDKSVMGRA